MSGNLSDGFVPIARDLNDHPVLDDAVAYTVYNKILFRVRYSATADAAQPAPGHSSRISVEVGEAVIGRNELARRIRVGGRPVGEKAIRGALERLEERWGLISTRSTPLGTVVRVPGYADFWGPSNRPSTSAERGQAIGQPAGGKGTNPESGLAPQDDDAFSPASGTEGPSNRPSTGADGGQAIGQAPDRGGATNRYLDTERHSRASASEVSQAELDEVYALYPRKRGKKPGMAAARRKVRTRGELEALRTAVERMARDWAGHDTSFCPYWSTYVQQERWRDEEPLRPSQPPPQATRAGADAPIRQLKVLG